MFQRLPGNVFHRQQDLAVPAGYVQIDAGARHGVFAAVGQKVVDDPPQVPPVGGDVSRRFGQEVITGERPQAASRSAYSARA